MKKSPSLLHPQQLLWGWLVPYASGLDSKHQGGFTLNVLLQMDGYTHCQSSSETRMPYGICLYLEEPSLYLVGAPSTACGNNPLVFLSSLLTSSDLLKGRKGAPLIRIFPEPNPEQMVC